MKKKHRRTFTAEFKSEAVRLVRQEGMSIAEVSRDLDVNASCLGRWVKQSEVDEAQGPPDAKTTEERDEIRRLKRRVRELEMEREILKKATAFFVRESK